MGPLDTGIGIGPGPDTGTGGPYPGISGATWELGPKGASLARDPRAGVGDDRYFSWGAGCWGALGSSGVA